MRKSILGLVVVGTATLASAFDTTVKDDFWDTTTYAGLSPSRISVVAAGKVDTVLSLSRNGLLGYDFSTFAPGFLLFLK